MILKVLAIFSEQGNFFPLKNGTFNVANRFHSRLVSTLLLSYTKFE